jgi:hypothetical protein
VINENILQFQFQANIGTNNYAITIIG